MSCRMACTLGKDAQKSIPQPIIRGISSTSDRTAFRNFWGTTATDNLINHVHTGLVVHYSTKILISYQLWRYRGCNIHLRARVDDETSTRSNMFSARKNNKRTRVPTARIDTCSTNSGPFLKLYTMLCIFFCHCPSLPGSNVSASLSLSHAYHVLMVCL
jgi:hypothetical protein